MAGKFYAVKKGRVPGIYSTWNDCKIQVDGFGGAIYKSFKTAAEAAEYMGWGNVERTEKTDNICEKEPKQQPKQQGEEAMAYVDGSFNVATGEFSYGVVMFHNGEEIHFNKKFNDLELSSMRNVAGEIKGSEAAMQYAYEHNIKKITIYHDYEGISRWPLREWKANKAGTISYRDFYDEISKYVDIEFVKVKGHSGDKYNDIADQLAKQALGL